MNDFFEIDFLNIESKKSGDAIPSRYCQDGVTRIHVTDGGYQSSGELLVEHIRNHYGNPRHIDSVLVTHPDGDHAGGLRALFDEFTIGELWMLKPWDYAADIINRFPSYSSVNALEDKLKKLYPNLAILEEMANKNEVPIREPFQGSVIGHFHVLAPSKSKYLDLIVASERTPESTTIDESGNAGLSGLVQKMIQWVASSWGEERFPTDDTSAENNMSVIQYAFLSGEKILLTGDAGRAAFEDAAEYAPAVGLVLPGIDRIQIPHHGSRHNVSTEMLDRWLGEKHSVKQESTSFSAIVSASKEDDNHPRNAVVRAFIHRGAKVFSTENGHLCSYKNSPHRAGWSGVTAVEYPTEQEA